MPTRFWGARTHNSDICVTQIPNMTFATPYVSRPFLSHARSGSSAVGPQLLPILLGGGDPCAAALEVIPRGLSTPQKT